MAKKADFTEQEWESLQKGVVGAGLLVSLSDRSFFDFQGGWCAWEARRAGEAEQLQRPRPRPR